MLYVISDHAFIPLMKSVGLLPRSSFHIHPRPYIRSKKRKPLCKAFNGSGHILAALGLFLSYAFIALSLVLKEPQGLGGLGFRGSSLS